MQKTKGKNADALFVSWNQYNQHVIWEEKRVKGYKEEGRWWQWSNCGQIYKTGVINGSAARGTGGKSTPNKGRLAGLVQCNGLKWRES